MSARASLNPTATELRVAGLTRLSSCDWPGELVATVFCQGCGWDCAYCYNPGLRPPQGDARIPWAEIATFLESRRGLLDGVVFSGGEPTLQPALLSAVQAVRRLGFRVGLHTAGMAPERFAALLPFVDWVGFDVKAPFRVYSRITGVGQSGTKALSSLRLLLASGISYEVRTTLHPALLSPADMLELQEELLALGVARYAVQRFRSDGARSGRLPALSGELSLPLDYGEAFRDFSIR
jgi:pyruvate formate lyase activating enzyme